MQLLKTFGQAPGKLERKHFHRSERFAEGRFSNAIPTTTLVKGVNFFRILWRFLNKPRNTEPDRPLSVIKPVSIPNGEETGVIWFGHSSYFIRAEGLNILVDPVFSGHAAPFSFAGRSFKGGESCSVADLPEIDLLVITHDHYDHLDWQTVRQLIPKTRQVVTSLGVGAHLRYWGYPADRICELDWWESRDFFGRLELTATPARHFSGRSFRRNTTFWSSFVGKVSGFQFFIGADSGYGDHFRQVGERFGPFDLAFLECGQYNEWWPDIHMMPEQTAQAALDLKARCLLPVHWAKFALAVHPWNEPVERLLKRAHELGITVATPMIGELFVPGKTLPRHHWWL